MYLLRLTLLSTGAPDRVNSTEGNDFLRFQSLVNQGSETGKPCQNRYFAVITVFQDRDKIEGSRVAMWIVVNMVSWRSRKVSPGNGVIW